MGGLLGRDEASSQSRELGLAMHCMHEAKTKLSGLPRSAAKKSSSLATARQRRGSSRSARIPTGPPGILAGEIELGPDFDDPLPEFDSSMR